MEQKLDICAVMSGANEVSRMFLGGLGVGSSFKYWAYPSAVASISNERIRELLDGPHQAVLSVGREGKGPVAVPMSYTYDGDRFFFVTSPTSLHGRLMTKGGRATLTIQFEEVGVDSVYQWYVMAEGRVVFTDADPAPHVQAMLIKDRGSQNWDRWRASEPSPDARVAELVFERISGYEFGESLDG